jgi:hypothetical protein
MFLFTFFLDKKSNKKIKANPNAPPDLPLLTHKFQNYWLRVISVIVTFSLDVISLHVGPLPRLMPPRLEHTAGAIFFACSSLNE